MKISATVITKNEEINIERCLASLDFADEIVIVDAESTDRTVELAQKYTPKVYINPWPGHIQQKNLAIEKAEGDWILSLDADEEITPELRDEIASARARFFDGMDGYFIPRHSLFIGRWIDHCGWRPDYHLRLFKKKKGRFGGLNPHDKVDLRGVTDRFRNPMKHYTYQNLDLYLSRMNSYSSIAAEELLRIGKRCRWRHLTISPAATFIKMYLIKQGFRDGAEGFLLCALSAYSVLMKYMKLKELWEVNRAA